MYVFTTISWILMILIWLWKIVKISKYCYRIDVTLKSLATTFLLGTIQIEISKAEFLDDLIKPRYTRESLSVEILGKSVLTTRRSRRRRRRISLMWHTVSLWVFMQLLVLSFLIPWAMYRRQDNLHKMLQTFRGGLHHRPWTRPTEDALFCG